MGVIATDEVSRPLSPEAAKEEADSPHPSDEVVREKHRCLFTEKKVCPPISLLGYTWVEEEVRTLFFRYNNKLDIINLLSWLHINTIPKDDDCLITFRVVRLDTTLPLKFVFMNKESKNREFFYIYKCLF